MDIRQSNEYARFMTSIGWQVKKIGECNAFVKKFPLLGSFIKIQRIEKIPPLSLVNELIQKERAFKIVIEPCSDSDTSDLINHGFKPTTPYAPSKTIRIDLKPSLDEILCSFSKEKRRIIRKAGKNNIEVGAGTIEEFIKLKVSRFSLLKFLLVKMIHNIFTSFSPDKAMILIAGNDSKLLGGILLLFYYGVAYYWMAAATNEGKKLAAPSLLVWEALKLAKEKGCTIFDFEGVFDERFPKQTNSWKGFTRFKEGFGGKTVYLPFPYEKRSFSFCH